MASGSPYAAAERGGWPSDHMINAANRLLPFRGNSPPVFRLCSQNRAILPVLWRDPSEVLAPPSVQQTLE